MFLFYLFIFVFGLIVGSFLNVVIFRMETGEQVVRGRSHCRHCNHILKWYDLFPVLSFLALRGRCRYCKKALSIQYPLVELATGMLLVLSLRATLGAAISYLEMREIASSLLLFAMTIGNFLFYLFIVSVLIVIFVYDLKHYIIPDKIIYPAIIISAVYQLVNVLKFINLDLFVPPAGGLDLGFWIFNTFLNGLFASILAGGFFLAIVLLTRGKGMGGGDVKLAFLMGLVLGWPKILPALFLAFTIGAICGIILMFFRKKTFKSEIPFGPFLVLGTFIALFWGEEIARWYGGYIF